MKPLIGRRKGYHKIYEIICVDKHGLTVNIHHVITFDNKRRALKFISVAEQDGIWNLIIQEKTIPFDQWVLMFDKLPTQA